MDTQRLDSRGMRYVKEIRTTETTNQQQLRVYTACGAWIWNVPFHPNHHGKSSLKTPQAIPAATEIVAKAALLVSWNRFIATLRERIVDVSLGFAQNSPDRDLRGAWAESLRPNHPKGSKVSSRFGALTGEVRKCSAKCSLWPMWTTPKLGYTDIHIYFRFMFDIVPKVVPNIMHLSLQVSLALLFYWILLFFGQGETAVRQPSAPKAVLGVGWSWCPAAKKSSRLGRNQHHRSTNIYGWICSAIGYAEFFPKISISSKWNGVPILLGIRHVVCFWTCFPAANLATCGFDWTCWGNIPNPIVHHVP